MKQLWAPWRMSYILEPPPQGCVFCFPSEQDVSCHVLKRTAHAMVMLNKYPYTNGHLLVMPLRHVARPQDLAPEEFTDWNELLLESVVQIEKTLGAHGLNVGMNLGRVAGAGVDQHVHFHIVPRWNGDHNFMAVVGEVHMINQHLEETYQQLRPVFQSG